MIRTLFTHLAILSALLTVWLGTSTVSFAQSNKPIPLIVDTDMGTDDWIAIAYIAQNKNIDLRGVTIVGSGLASCAYAVHNAKHILSMSVRNANKPVGCGSNWPLDGYASYPTIWRTTGADMMGEVKPSLNIGRSEWYGPTLLAELLNQSIEPVDILAIGSMTNIASVLRVEPELKHKIRQIISMGGAVNHAGNLRVHGFTDGHTNTKAEWNYYIDPVAAKIVFESGVPVTLVPLDATNRVPLTQEFTGRFDRAASNPLEAFVHRIFQKILVSTTKGEYFHWDPLAAAIAAHPELCDQTQTIKLSVVAEKGKDEGLVNGQPREAFPFYNYLGQKRNALSEFQAGATVKSDKGNDIKVCMHVDAAKFEDHFLQMMRTAE